jgi:holo-[acyl-carrier protein] synthase
MICHVVKLGPRNQGDSYMLVGLGVDIIEVPRIKKALNRWGERFLKRVFTPDERRYSLRKAFPEQSLAARFAAKEAVMKALGTGLSGGIAWTDVEIVNTPRGKPEVRLRGKIASRVGEKKVQISLSHTKEYAVAFAVIEGEEKSIDHLSL